MPAKSNSKPTPKSRGRSKGRPSTDGEVGADTILRATCELVKTMSPEKITRAEVARQAGVDPGLIRYYFSDRSSLLRAAAAAISSEFQQAAQSLIQPDATPEENLRVRIREFLKLHQRYPYYSRLVVEEIVELDPEEEGGNLLGPISNRGHNAYSAILSAGVDSGDFRQVDTKLFYVMVVSVFNFTAPAKRILAILDHESADSDTSFDEISEFVTDILLNGILVGKPSTLK